jgi:uncharacterized integral membrane protein
MGPAAAIAVNAAQIASTAATAAQVGFLLGLRCNGAPLHVYVLVIHEL